MKNVGRWRERNARFSAVNLSYSYVYVPRRFIREEYTWTRFQSATKGIAMKVLISEWDVVLATEALR